MAPSVPTASITLSYPLYAADFDPNDSNFLIVGGGGGPGRSGVKNKLSVVDARRRYRSDGSGDDVNGELVELSSLDLGRDADAVSSLAVAQADERSAVVFAGINSGDNERRHKSSGGGGQNEHLRSFRLGYPVKKKQDVKERDPEQGYGELPLPEERIRMKKEAEEKKRLEEFERIERLQRGETINEEEETTTATTTGADAAVAGASAPPAESSEPAPDPVESEMLSKAALFASPKVAPPATDETYQRILRLSPPDESSLRRLGAVATGLAPKDAGGEIVLFDASAVRMSAADVRHRIRLDKGVEAMDVDIIENLASEDENQEAQEEEKISEKEKSGKGGKKKEQATTDEDDFYLLAYCTDYDISLCSVPFNPHERVKPPFLLYETPHADFFEGKKARPMFRSLRFLSPDLLALVQNLPGRTGAEILLLSVPSQRTQRGVKGTVLLRKTLHKGIKGVTAFAAATLPPPPTSAVAAGLTKDRNAQHILAAAGNDGSVTVLALDVPYLRHSSSKSRSSSKLALRQYALFRSVHSLPPTCLAFSRFRTPESASTLRAPAQHLRLASGSMSGSLVVMTFPLVPYPPVNRDGIVPRYTLIKPKQGLGRGAGSESAFAITMALFVLAAAAILLQAFTEIRGGTPDILGAKAWLPESVRDRIARPYIFADYPGGRPPKMSKEARYRHLVKTGKIKPIEKGEGLGHKKDVGADKDGNDGPVGAQLSTKKAAPVKAKPVEKDEDYDEDEDYDDDESEYEEGDENDGEEDDDNEKEEETDSGSDRSSSSSAARKAQISAEHAGLRLRDMLMRRRRRRLSGNRRGGRGATVPGANVNPQAQAPLLDNVQKAMFVQVGGDDGVEELSAELLPHHDERHLAARGGKRWEDLSRREKAGWRKKLADAGAWAAEEGDAVLKGVFFGEIAGAVAGAVAG